MRIAQVMTVAVAMAFAVSAIAGCSEARLRTLGSTESAPSSALHFEELPTEELIRLGHILEGEIQTVYPSDTGLVRVYGQVANLGEESFEAVQFDVVADLKGGTQTADANIAEDSRVRRTVASFVVAPMRPGDMEPFEVQTTVKPGEFRTLQVRVSGVR